MSVASQTGSQISDSGSAFSEVARRLARCHTVEDLASEAACIVRQFANADGAAFTLLDSGLVHFLAVDAREQDTTEFLWKGRRFEPNTCICGWVIRHRETLFIPDVTQDSRVLISHYDPAFVHSLAVFPMRPHRPLGAIGVYWSRAHRPSQDEMTALELLTGVIALSAERVSRRRSVPRPPAATHGYGRRILVVDDEPSLRTVTTAFLNQIGYQAAAAADAMEALALLSDPERKFDLLITDLHMPRMSGYELAGEARRARPDLCILFVSGSLGGPESVDILPECFLQKPFALPALAERIHRQLGPVPAAVTTH